MPFKPTPLNSLSCLALLAATPAAAVDWPQPGLNGAHTGYNAQETTISAANLASLRQKFAVSIPNGFTAPPIELAGITYLQSNDGTVYAINATNGQPVWTYAAGPGTGLEGVTAGNSLVYAPCRVDNNGHAGICALNAATGALVWSFAIITVGGQTVTSSYASNIPVLLNGKIFFAYTYGGFNSPASGQDIFALNATTGAQIWGYGEPYGDRSGGQPFAAAYGSVFFQTGDVSANDTVCALNQVNGAVRGCSQTIGYGDMALSASGGKLLATNNDAAQSNTVFTALNATTLAVDWQKTVAGFTSNYSIYPPAIANKLAYFYAGQNGHGSLYALSLITGAQSWTYACNATACVNSGISVANGVVFASCDQETPQQGDQCAFDAATGALLRLYGSLDGHAGSQATPLVANGKVIAACDAYSGALCKFSP